MNMDLDVPDALAVPEAERKEKEAKKARAGRTVKKAVFTPL